MMALTVCACGNSHAVVKEARTDMATAATAKAKDTGRTTKTLPLDGFTGISSAGNIRLTVRQGKSFSVKASATEELWEKTDISVENGTLNIRLKNEKNKNTVMIAGDSPTMTVEVSCPQIDRISCAGVGSADIGPIESRRELSISLGGNLHSTVGDIRAEGVKITKGGVGKLTLGNIDASKEYLDLSIGGNSQVETGNMCAGIILIKKSGVGKLNVGNVIANGGQFQLSLGGNNHTTIGGILAEGVNIYKGGVGELSLGNIDAGHKSLELSIGGNSKIWLKDVAAAGMTANLGGVSKFVAEKITLGDKDMTLNVGGNQQLTTSTITANAVTVKRSGVGSVTIDVHCRKLNIDHGGHSGIKVTGEADNVKIKGGGITNVDTSGLNNF